MINPQNRESLKYSSSLLSKDDVPLLFILSASKSSVDYKGRVPIRVSTGVWKAFAFVIAFEFSERLSYFALGTSLVIYLTDVVHEDLKSVAKNVNYWNGVTTMMPLVGGFLADAYFGRYLTVLISASIYLLGLILLTMSWFIPSLKPCHGYACDKHRKVHEIVFFIAMYMISLASGGHKPSLQSFGADQFDDDHAEERKQKMSFFSWWNAGICCGIFLGVTVIVYVQEHVNWGTADIILMLAMSISFVVFIYGRQFYRYRPPGGSPFTPMMQVIVAAIAKRKLPYPSDPAQLYENTQMENMKTRFLFHTKKFRCLDKAAIVEDENVPREKRISPWRLATVTKVEEFKLILGLLPVWLLSIPFALCVAQQSTFYIKQTTVMDRKIGEHFLIPSASIYTLTTIAGIISITMYEKILVPISRRITKTERGITLLQRIGIGMAFMVLAMVVAAFVEKKRLDVARNDPSNSSSSMSVFWLAPQFFIMGFGEGFGVVGFQEFFYDQVPDSMRSIGIALYLSIVGAANFLSSLLVTIVDKVSMKLGHDWFGKDLDSSRLDNFYWLLVVISSVDLCIYVFVAYTYSYKNAQRTVGGNFPVKESGEELLI